VAGHVFLSYAREDGAYVQRLRAYLHERGVETWVDSETDYGTRWTQVVREKIDSCAALIVVMTPEAERSEWVEREIHRAETRGKLIVPLLLRGQSFFRLGVTQFVDVTDGGLPPDEFVYRLTPTARGADITLPPLLPPPETPPETPSAASVAAPTPPTSGAADVEFELLWQGIATVSTRDIAIAVELDGEPIVDRPMRHGFRATERCPVGPHTLTVISNDKGKGLVRMRHYRIEAIAGHEFTIVLRWSRLLQNFTKELMITSR
jgi:hypothetical protein